MLTSIHKEILLRASYLEKETVETIYFGGGTPSLLSEQELRTLLHTIQETVSLSANPEITLEANPDDIFPSALSAWKNAGVNRLSIGLQSFKSSDLTWMNRTHTAEEAEQCVELARHAGFTDLTVDLIYGLPGLTNSEWKEHIEKVIRMGVTHVSAYCLTVEEKTPLSSWVEKGKIIPASEDDQGEQFILLVDTLHENGFQQYEISNFSLSGHESIHNSNYWKGKAYLGVGPSAHSFNGHSRSWNVANNRKYMKGISEKIPYIETEELTPKNQFNERILTGLRTMYGVSIHALSSISPIPSDVLSKATQFIEQGWMTMHDDHIWTLTQEGRLRADHIASELFIH